MVDETIIRSALDWLSGALPPAPTIAIVSAVAVSGVGAGGAVPLSMEAAEPVPEWATADGIVGLGLGEKETQGKILQDLALKIYVEKKRPLAAVDHPIPKWIEIAGLPRVDTDVVEVGKIERQSNTARIRPALPGYSVGRALDKGEAGTFGMVVRKRGQTSPLYLLSNSHAIAASGFATKGDAIVQPGAYDGGAVPNDTIGTLEQWIPFQYTAAGFPNTVDAAIARLDDGAASAAIAQLGVPKGVNTNLRRGMYVQKMGRTTTLSVARVQDIDLRVPATYPDGSGRIARVGFADQVLVTFYSSGGDSGSPVLDMDNNVVGLHMAGSAIIGIFCKISNIVSQLDIEIVTAENLA
jgi:hypothetical protein